MLELIVANIATIHPELLPKRQLYIPITEWQQARMTQTFLNYWRNNMKTLTTTAIILSLALSGSAYAASSYQSGNNSFWAENTQLLERASNPNDSSDFSSSYNRSIGSQPEVGSTTGNSIQSGSSNFWKENGALLERASNPNDSSAFAYYQVDRTGSQPEVGSAFQDVGIQSGVSNFWKENVKLLSRDTNPADQN